MKTGQELFVERLNRLNTAKACGKPDRVPVVLIGDTFAAKIINMPLSKFYSDPAISHQAIMDASKLIGDFDSLGMIATNSYISSINWLSKIKIPGVDLPDNAIVQVVEEELMTEEDYDTIIDKGWMAFFLDICTNRLDNVLAKIAPVAEFMPTAVKNVIDAGYVPFIGTPYNSPFDCIAGPRSLSSFIKDLYRIPDKVEAALDVVSDFFANQIKQELSGSEKPFTTFVGGARCSTGFLSPKLWERFSWKYTKKMIDAITESGGTAYLHFDGDWMRALPRLEQELPKTGQIIVGADGTNDIFEYKRILGDKFCLFGDVPASILSLGTPDEVYNYCVKLCKEIGPSGFILAAGCTVPYITTLDNMKAMVSAATGK